MIFSFPENSAPPGFGDVLMTGTLRANRVEVERKADYYLISRHLARITRIRDIFTQVQELQVERPGVAGSASGVTGCPAVEWRVTIRSDTSAEL
jgi:hypothetical protein